MRPQKLPSVALEDPRAVIATRHGGAAADRERTRGNSPAFVLGILAWIAIMVALWPLATSFGDEVGYVGEARLLLSGRLKPVEGDVGVWEQGRNAAGVAKYPLLQSLLLAPLVAVSPRAVFVLGILSAIAVCVLAGRLLRWWGDDPAWALILLAHPTIVILARTAMADLPLCAFMLGAWWALRRDRLRAAILLFGALFAIKTTGTVIGAALAAGELWRRLPALRRRDPAALRALIAVLLAVTAGAGLAAASNVLTTGGVGYAQFPDPHPFSFTHFPRTAPEQLRTVLLLPALLFLGALPFWRAREHAPLLVIVGFGGLMCFYFFVDFGTSWIETWVLAPRLLLPVVVFLLIGYAHLLAVAARRWLRRDRLVNAGLVAVAVSVALVVSLLHQQWQRPMGLALDAAKRTVAETGARELGVLPQAAKIGVLVPGPVRMVDPSDWRSSVVLCSDRSASYRQRERDGAFSCVKDGYRLVYRAGDFELLVRDDAAGARR